EFRVSSFEFRVSSFEDQNSPPLGAQGFYAFDFRNSILVTCNSLYYLALARIACGQAPAENAAGPAPQNHPQYLPFRLGTVYAVSGVTSGI
ncbi:MAG: hypothetical protein ACPH3N_14610, partial [Alcanivorax sediminis]|uniref:hypothetical protein n=1 Tax=Alcanivorax sediminis TaxID=2663008 RepID=UPI003C3A6938